MLLSGSERLNRIDEEALAIVLCYFDEEHILPKTRLALEELLRG